METIKLGMIGSNFVSDWLADSANASDKVELYAIYSRTREKGEEFASCHGIPNVFCDMEEFLNSDIDAVYIASPNCLHCEQTLAAVAHGKHVLCEKPIASNSAEYARMRRAAEEKGVILLEAMRPAFDPALEAVKENLHRLGKIRRASFEFCQYSSRYDKYRAGEILQAFRPEFSNSSLMDIGVYPVHFALRLFGEPTGEIKSSSVILPNGFEGSGEIIVPYGDMNVTVSYSKIFDSVTPSVIIGEDGAITIDKMSCPSRLTFIPGKGEPEAIPFNFSETNMDFEIAEFARLIRDGEVNNVHARYSEMEMKVLDTVRAQNSIIFPADK